MQDCPEVLEPISNARIAKGWSVKKLSQESGVTEPTTQKFLSGATQDPSFTNIVRMCKALGLSIDDLVGIDDSRMIHDLQEQIEALKRENQHLKDVAAVAESKQEYHKAMESKYYAESQAAEGRIADLIEGHEKLIAEKDRSNRRLLIFGTSFAVAFLALTIAVVGILIYDITHLDRGWFQAMADTYYNSGIAGYFDFA